MRLFGVGVALLVATGCTADQVSLEHQSQLETRARGLALLDTEDAAQVGMAGNTCEVQTSTGMIGADTDVAPGEEDNVQDALSEQALVMGTAGVYTVDRGGMTFGSTPTVNLENGLQARFTAGGEIVALAGTPEGCAVTWQGAESTAVPACDEQSGFALDRRTETAFVANGDSLTIVEPGAEPVVVDGAFDMVAFNDHDANIFVSSVGGRTVEARDRNGEPVWAIDVEGDISSMDDMGEMGAVAVTFQDGAIGRLLILDGATGAQLNDTELPSAPARVLVGNNGASMAMVVDGGDVRPEIHFFSVDLDVDPISLE